MSRKIILNLDDIFFSNRNIQIEKYILNTETQDKDIETIIRCESSNDNILCIVNSNNVSTMYLKNTGSVTITAYSDSLEKVSKTITIKKNKLFLEFLDQLKNQTGNIAYEYYPYLNNEKYYYDLPKLYLKDNNSNTNIEPDIKIIQSHHQYVDDKELYGNNNVIELVNNTFHTNTIGDALMKCTFNISLDQYHNPLNTDPLLLSENTQKYTDISLSGKNNPDEEPNPSEIKLYNYDLKYTLSKNNYSIIVSEFWNETFTKIVAISIENVIYKHNYGLNYTNTQLNISFFYKSKEFIITNNREKFVYNIYPELSEEYRYEEYSYIGNYSKKYGIFDQEEIDSKKLLSLPLDKNVSLSWQDKKFSGIDYIILRKDNTSDDEYSEYTLYWYKDSNYSNLQNTINNTGDWNGITRIKNQELDNSLLEIYLNIFKTGKINYIILSEQFENEEIFFTPATDSDKLNINIEKVKTNNEFSDTDINYLNSIELSQDKNNYKNYSYSIKDSIFTLNIYYSINIFKMMDAIIFDNKIPYYQNINNKSFVIQAHTRSDELIYNIQKFPGKTNLNVKNLREYNSTIDASELRVNYRNIGKVLFTIFSESTKYAYGGNRSVEFYINRGTSSIEFNNFPEEINIGDFIDLDLNQFIKVNPPSLNALFNSEDLTIVETNSTKLIPLREGEVIIDIYCPGNSEWSKSINYKKTIKINKCVLQNFEILDNNGDGVQTEVELYFEDDIKHEFMISKFITDKNGKYNLGLTDINSFFYNSDMIENFNKKFNKELRIWNDQLSSYDKKQLFLQLENLVLKTKIDNKIDYNKPLLTIENKNKRSDNYFGKQEEIVFIIRSNLKIDKDIQINYLLKQNGIVKNINDSWVKILKSGTNYLEIIYITDDSNGDVSIELLEDRDNYMLETNSQPLVNSYFKNENNTINITQINDSRLVDNNNIIFTKRKQNYFIDFEIESKKIDQGTPSQISYIVINYPYKKINTYSLELFSYNESTSDYDQTDFNFSSNRFLKRINGFRIDQFIVKINEYNERLKWKLKIGKPLSRIGNIEILSISIQNQLFNNFTKRNVFDKNLVKKSDPVFDSSFGDNGIQHEIRIIRDKLNSIPRVEKFSVVENINNNIVCRKISNNWYIKSDKSPSEEFTGSYIERNTIKNYDGQGNDKLNEDPKFVRPILDNRKRYRFNHLVPGWGIAKNFEIFIKCKYKEINSEEILFSVGSSEVLNEDQYHKYLSINKKIVNNKEVLVVKFGDSLSPYEWYINEKINSDDIIDFKLFYKQLQSGLHQYSLWYKINDKFEIEDTYDKYFYPNSIDSNTCDVWRDNRLDIWKPLGSIDGPKINPFLNTGALIFEHGGKWEPKWKEFRQFKPTQSIILDFCLRMGWSKPLAKYKDFKPGADVSDKVVFNLDLRRRDMRNLNFSNSFLMNSQLNDAYLHSCNFFNSYLDHVNFSGSDISYCNFEGLHFQNISRGIVMFSVNIDRTKCTGTNLNNMIVDESSIQSKVWDRQRKVKRDPVTNEVTQIKWKYKKKNQPFSLSIPIAGILMDELTILSFNKSPSENFDFFLIVRDGNSNSGFEYPLIQTGNINGRPVYYGKHGHNRTYPQMYVEYSGKNNVWNIYSQNTTNPRKLENQIIEDKYKNFPSKLLVSQEFALKDKTMPSSGTMSGLWWKIRQISKSDYFNVKSGNFNNRNIWKHKKIPTITLDNELYVDSNFQKIIFITNTVVIPKNYTFNNYGIIIVLGLLINNGTIINYGKIKNMRQIINYGKIENIKTDNIPDELQATGGEIINNPDFSIYRTVFINKGIIINGEKCFISIKDHSVFKSFKYILNSGIININSELILSNISKIYNKGSINYNNNYKIIKNNNNIIHQDFGNILKYHWIYQQELLTRWPFHICWNDNEGFNNEAPFNYNDRNKTILFDLPYKMGYYRKQQSELSYLVRCNGCPAVPVGWSGFAQSDTYIYGNITAVSMISLDNSNLYLDNHILPMHGGTSFTEFSKFNFYRNEPLLRYGPGSILFYDDNKEKYRIMNDWVNYGGKKYNLSEVGTSFYSDSEQKLLTTHDDIIKHQNTDDIIMRMNKEIKESDKQYLGEGIEIPNKNKVYQENDYNYWQQIIKNIAGKIIIEINTKLEPQFIKLNLQDKNNNSIFNIDHNDLDQYTKYEFMVDYNILDSPYQLNLVSSDTEGWKDQTISLKYQISSNHERDNNLNYISKYVSYTENNSESELNEVKLNSSSKIINFSPQETTFNFINNPNITDEQFNSYYRNYVDKRSVISYPQLGRHITESHHYSHLYAYNIVFNQKSLLYSETYSKMIIEGNTESYADIVATQVNNGNNEKWSKAYAYIKTLSDIKIPKFSVNQQDSSIIIQLQDIDNEDLNKFAEYYAEKIYLFNSHNYSFAYSQLKVSSPNDNERFYVSFANERDKKPQPSYEYALTFAYLYNTLSNDIYSIKYNTAYIYQNLISNFYKNGNQSNLSSILTERELVFENDNNIPDIIKRRSDEFSKYYANAIEDDYSSLYGLYFAAMKMNNSENFAHGFALQKDKLVPENHENSLKYGQYYEEAGKLLFGEISSEDILQNKYTNNDLILNGENVEIINNPFIENVFTNEFSFELKVKPKSEQINSIIHFKDNESNVIEIIQHNKSLYFKLNSINPLEFIDTLKQINNPQERYAMFRALDLPDRKKLHKVLESESNNDSRVKSILDLFDEALTEFDKEQLHKTKATDGNIPLIFIYSNIFFTTIQKLLKFTLARKDNFLIINLYVDKRFIKEFKLPGSILTLNNTSADVNKIIFSNLNGWKGTIRDFNLLNKAIIPVSNINIDAKNTLNFMESYAQNKLDNPSLSSETVTKIAELMNQTPPKSEVYAEKYAISISEGKSEIYANKIATYLNRGYNLNYAKQFAELRDSGKSLTYSEGYSEISQTSNDPILNDLFSKTYENYLYHKDIDKVDIEKSMYYKFEGFPTEFINFNGIYKFRGILDDDEDKVIGKTYYVWENEEPGNHNLLIYYPQGRKFPKEIVSKYEKVISEKESKTSKITNEVVEEPSNWREENAYWSVGYPIEQKELSIKILQTKMFDFKDNEDIEFIGFRECEYIEYIPVTGSTVGEVIPKWAQLKDFNSPSMIRYIPTFLKNLKDLMDTLDKVETLSTTYIRYYAEGKYILNYNDYFSDIYAKKIDFGWIPQRAEYYINCLLLEQKSEIYCEVYSERLYLTGNQEISHFYALMFTGEVIDGNQEHRLALLYSELKIYFNDNFEQSEIIDISKLYKNIRIVTTENGRSIEINNRGNYETISIDFLKDFIYKYNLLLVNSNTLGIAYKYANYFVNYQNKNRIWKNNYFYIREESEIKYNHTVGLLYANGLENGYSLIDINKAMDKFNELSPLFTNKIYLLNHLEIYLKIIGHFNDLLSSNYFIDYLHIHNNEGNDDNSLIIASKYIELMINGHSEQYSLCFIKLLKEGYDTNYAGLYAEISAEYPNLLNHQLILYINTYNIDNSFIKFDQNITKEKRIEFVEKYSEIKNNNSNSYTDNQIWSYAWSFITYPNKNEEIHHQFAQMIANRSFLYTDTYFNLTQGTESYKHVYSDVIDKNLAKNYRLRYNDDLIGPQLNYNLDSTTQEWANYYALRYENTQDNELSALYAYLRHDQYSDTYSKVFSETFNTINPNNLNYKYSLLQAHKYVEVYEKYINLGKTEKFSKIMGYLSININSEYDLNLFAEYYFNYQNTIDNKKYDNFYTDHYIKSVDNLLEINKSLNYVQEYIKFSNDIIINNIGSILSSHKVEDLTNNLRLKLDWSSKNETGTDYIIIKNDLEPTDQFGSYSFNWYKDPQCLIRQNKLDYPGDWNGVTRISKINENKSILDIYLAVWLSGSINSITSYSVSDVINLKYYDDQFCTGIPYKNEIINNLSLKLGDLLGNESQLGLNSNISVETFNVDKYDSINNTVYNECIKLEWSNSNKSGVDYIIIRNDLIPKEKFGKYGIFWYKDPECQILQTKLDIEGDWNGITRISKINEDKNILGIYLAVWWSGNINKLTRTVINDSLILDKNLLIKDIKPDICILNQRREQIKYFAKFEIKDNNSFIVNYYNNSSFSGNIITSFNLKDNYTLKESTIKDGLQLEKSVILISPTINPNNLVNQNVNLSQLPNNLKFKVDYRDTHNNNTGTDYILFKNDFISNNDNSRFGLVFYSDSDYSIKQNSRIIMVMNWYSGEVSTDQTWNGEYQVNIGSVNSISVGNMYRGAKELNEIINISYFDINDGLTKNIELDHSNTLKDIFLQLGNNYELSRINGFELHYISDVNHIKNEYGQIYSEMVLKHNKTYAENYMNSYELYRINSMNIDIIRTKNNNSQSTCGKIFADLFETSDLHNSIKELTNNDISNKLYQFSFIYSNLLSYGFSNKYSKYYAFESIINTNQVGDYYEMMGQIMGNSKEFSYEFAKLYVEKKYNSGLDKSHTWLNSYCLVKLGTYLNDADSEIKSVLYADKFSKKNENKLQFFNTVDNIVLFYVDAFYTFDETRNNIDRSELYSQIRELYPENYSLLYVKYKLIDNKQFNPQELDLYINLVLNGISETDALSGVEYLRSNDNLYSSQIYLMMNTDIKDKTVSNNFITRDLDGVSITYLLSEDEENLQKYFELKNTISTIYAQQWIILNKTANNYSSNYKNIYLEKIQEKYSLIYSDNYAKLLDSDNSKQYSEYYAEKIDNLSNIGKLKDGVYELTYYGVNNSIEVKDDQITFKNINNETIIYNWDINTLKYNAVNEVIDWFIIRRDNTIKTKNFVATYNTNIEDYFISLYDNIDSLEQLVSNYALIRSYLKDSKSELEYDQFANLVEEGKSYIYAYNQIINNNNNELISYYEYSENNYYNYTSSNVKILSLELNEYSDHYFIEQEEEFKGLYIFDSKHEKSLCYQHIINNEYYLWFNKTKNCTIILDKISNNWYLGKSNNNNHFIETNEIYYISSDKINWKDNSNQEKSIQVSVLSDIDYLYQRILLEYNISDNIDFKTQLVNKYNSYSESNLIKRLLYTRLSVDNSIEKMISPYNLPDVYVKEFINYYILKRLDPKDHENSWNLSRSELITKMKNDNIPWDTCLTYGFTFKHLLDNGYTFNDAIGSTTVNYSISDYKNYGIPLRTIKNNFTLDKLFDFTSTNNHYSISQLKNDGDYTLLDFYNTFTIDLTISIDNKTKIELFKNNGYTVTEFLTIYTLDDIRSINLFSVTDLKQSNINKELIINSSYTLQELYNGGYSILDLYDIGYSLNRLKTEINHPVSSLSSLIVLLDNNKVTLLELKELGYLVIDFKNISYMKLDILYTEFSLSDLLKEYSLINLRNSNIQLSIDDINNNNLTIEQLKRNGFTVELLKSYNYNLNDIYLPWSMTYSDNRSVTLNPNNNNSVSLTFKNDSTKAEHAILDSLSYWQPEVNNTEQYFKFNLPENSNILGITVQGNGIDSYVKKMIITNQEIDINNRPTFDTRSDNDFAWKLKPGSYSIGSYAGSYSTWYSATGFSISNNGNNLSISTRYGLLNYSWNDNNKRYEDGSYYISFRKSDTTFNGDGYKRSVTPNGSEVFYTNPDVYILNQSSQNEIVANNNIYDKNNIMFKKIYNSNQIYIYPLEWHNNISLRIGLIIEGNTELVRFDLNSIKSSYTIDEIKNNINFRLSELVSMNYSLDEIINSITQTFDSNNNRIDNDYKLSDLLNIYTVDDFMNRKTQFNHKELKLNFTLEQLYYKLNLNYNELINLDFDLTNLKEINFPIYILKNNGINLKKFSELGYLFNELYNALDDNNQKVFSNTELVEKNNNEFIYAVSEWKQNNLQVSEFRDTGLTDIQDYISAGYSVDEYYIYFEQNIVIQIGNASINQCKSFNYSLNDIKDNFTLEDVLFSNYSVSEILTIPKYNNFNNLLNMLNMINNSKITPEFITTNNFDKLQEIYNTQHYSLEEYKNNNVDFIIVLLLGFTITDIKTKEFTIKHEYTHQDYLDLNISTYNILNILLYQGKNLEYIYNLVVPTIPNGIKSIEYNGGSYPEEVSWVIKNSSGIDIFSNSQHTGGTMIVNAMIEGGTYTITGDDSYGDGWNGAYVTIQDLNNNTILDEFTFDDGHSSSQSFDLIVQQSEEKLFKLIELIDVFSIEQLVNITDYPLKDYINLYGFIDLYNFTSKYDINSEDTLINNENGNKIERIFNAGYSKTKFLEQFSDNDSMKLELNNLLSVDEKLQMIELMGDMNFTEINIFDVTLTNIKNNNPSILDRYVLRDYLISKFSFYDIYSNIKVKSTVFDPSVHTRDSSSGKTTAKQGTLNKIESGWKGSDNSWYQINLDNNMKITDIIILSGKENIYKQKVSEGYYTCTPYFGASTFTSINQGNNIVVPHTVQSGTTTYEWNDENNRYQAYFVGYLDYFELYSNGLLNHGWESYPGAGYSSGPRTWQPVDNGYGFNVGNPTSTNTGLVTKYKVEYKLNNSEWIKIKPLHPLNQDDIYEFTNPFNNDYDNLSVHYRRNNLFETEIEVSSIRIIPVSFSNHNLMRVGLIRNEEYKISDYVNNNYVLPDDLYAQYSKYNIDLSDIILSGVNKNKLTIEELKQNSISMTSLLELYTIEELITRGLQLNDFKDENNVLIDIRYLKSNKNNDLIIQDKTYTVNDFKNIGYTIVDLIKVFTITELKKYGYTTSNYYTINLPVMELNNDYTLEEIRNGGYTVLEVKNIYKLAEVQQFYTLTEVLTGNYSNEELLVFYSQEEILNNLDTNNE